MIRLKLHGLDDLDRTDIYNSFSEAFAQLENVYHKLRDYPAARRQVDSLLNEVDTIATMFEDAEYAADVNKNY